MLLSIVVQKFLHSTFSSWTKLPLIISCFTFARIIGKVRFQVMDEFLPKICAFAYVNWEPGFVVEGENSRPFWDLFRLLSPNIHFP